MGKIKRGNMFVGGGGGIHEREENDFYATPTATTKSFLKHFKIEGNNILEPSCVDGDTEYFDGYKWNKIKNYVEGDSVLQFNDNGTSSLVEPIEYIKEPASEFYSIDTPIINMRLTGEHTVYYYNAIKKLKTISMEELYNEHISTKHGFMGEIPTSFIYSGNITLNQIDVNLLTYLTFHGELLTGNKYAIKFNKHSEIEALNKFEQIILFNELEVERFESKKHIKFHIKLDRVLDLNTIYNLSFDTKLLFINSFYQMIGSENRLDRRVFSAKNKEMFDLVQMLLVSMGNTIKKIPNTYDIENLFKERGVDINRYSKKKRTIEKTHVQKGMFKYCFKVPSGKLILRRNNKIFITGNCGMGHISKVLEEEYPDKRIVSTDLIDRGYGETGINFLNHDYKETFDCIITNPPFKHAKEFVEKALEISEDKVIMLLKIQFLEGISRKEFLENSPLKYVYIHSKRQSTMKNGEELNPINGKPWSSTLLLAWFVWEKGYEGEPIIKWI